jgi:gamma-glutamylaminecyclotransferase
VTYVFVYGTLKRGFRLNPVMEAGGARFLGEAITAGKFAMWGRHFPYVASCRGGSQVVGELYDVSDELLARLDQIEGAPHHYQRRKIRVSVRGHAADAWVYAVDLSQLEEEVEVTAASGILTWTMMGGDDRDQDDEDAA